MKKSIPLELPFSVTLLIMSTLGLYLLPLLTFAGHVDAEISISTASPIFVSVSNLSDSTDVNERLLTMTTPAEITVKGQAQCTNGAAVQNVQLHFGLDFIESSPNGHTLWGIWDSSAPQLFLSTNNAAYAITHNVNISPTWDLGTLVTIEPNAVKVVEDNLKSYVNNGGSALDFLREDGSFEASVLASATVACERDGSVFFDTVSQSTTMHVLYKGDPNLEPQTVGQNPDQVDSNQPPSFGYALPSDLPKPGLTPASRFYFVERFFEGVGTFFTFGDSAKVKRYLGLSEERLAEAQALTERGDERAQVAVVRYEAQFNQAKERAERNGAADVEVAREAGDLTLGTEPATHITDVTTKHLAVIDEVLARVPQQAKASIEAAKERLIRGQVESLRRIAESQPETAALIFERATEARAAYYLKIGDIKGEARTESTDPTSVPSDFLQGFEEYAEFGEELAEMAQGIRVGETTVDELVERIADRDRVILKQLIGRVPEEAREGIARAHDKTTPKLERSAETAEPRSVPRDVPAASQMTRSPNTVEPVPVEIPPRVEQGSSSAEATREPTLDEDDDDEGVLTRDVDTIEVITDLEEDQTTETNETEVTREPTPDGDDDGDDTRTRIESVRMDTRSDSVR